MVPASQFTERQFLDPLGPDARRRTPAHRVGFLPVGDNLVSLRSCGSGAGRGQASSAGHTAVVRKSRHCSISDGLVATQQRCRLAAQQFDGFRSGQKKGSFWKIVSTSSPAGRYGNGIADAEYLSPRTVGYTQLQPVSCLLVRENNLSLEDCSAHSLARVLLEMVCKNFQSGSALTLARHALHVK